MPYAKLELGTNQIIAVNSQSIGGDIELTPEQMEYIKNRRGLVGLFYENGQLVEDEAFIAAYNKDMERKKTVVTRFQALAALDQAGLLTQVQAIMANPATPSITKLAWDNALEFKRLSPTVVSLGQALGLTDEQLDTLFTQAKSIEV